MLLHNSKHNWNCYCSHYQHSITFRCSDW